MIWSHKLGDIRTLALNRFFILEQKKLPQTLEQKRCVDCAAELELTVSLLLPLCWKLLSSQDLFIILTADSQNHHFSLAVAALPSLQ